MMLREVRPGPQAFRPRRASPIQRIPKRRRAAALQINFPLEFPSPLRQDILRLRAACSTRGSAPLPILPIQEHPVSDMKKTGVSRRDLLKTGTTVAAASALAGVVIPHVHAGETNT